MNNTKPEIHRTLTRGESLLTRARDVLHRQNLISVTIIVLSGLAVIALHALGADRLWFYAGVALLWLYEAHRIAQNHREFARFIDAYYPPPYRYKRKGK